jgi:integrase
VPDCAVIPVVRPGPNDLGLVFATPDGVVWRKDNFISRVFRPAVRRADLAPLRFHDLRHAYAALMVSAGAPEGPPSGTRTHLDQRDAEHVQLKRNLIKLLDAL